MNQDKDQNKSLKKNTLLSVISLFAQSGYSALLGLTANLILSIVLSPAIFGIYITVLAIISFLNYFSDIGLAASLIQKKDIDEEDKKTVFTVQQILIISLIIIGYLLTNLIKDFYKLDQYGVYLYWALLIGFYLASLKTIPSIILEKSLKFHKIATVQIIESTVFYVTVIILAIFNFNLSSFTIAVLLRAVIGVGLMYFISPWRPGIFINFSKLKKLLAFGVSFQTSSLLALFKDDLMILFLSKTLGFEAIGYIGWAKKWAEALIRIIMDNFTRVLFPLLSHLQDDKEKVSRVLEKLFYYQTLILAPTIIGLSLIMKSLVILIPKYQKWEVALPMFYLFSLSSLLLTFSSPFINFFNSIGKSKISLIFMIVWTAITWVFVPLFIKALGMIGYPIVHVIIASTFLIVLQTARKYIRIAFFKNIKAPLLSAFLMGIIVYWLNLYLKNTFSNLVLTIFIAIILYFVSLTVIFKKKLIADFREFVNLQN